jgi:hypothetical protein
MMKTDIRPSYAASISTPYMDTTEKCLRFFYRFLGVANDAITVSSTDEELNETITRTIRSGSISSDYWLPIIMKLPPKINAITITGIRGVGISGMALDDIEITRCSNFEGNYFTDLRTSKFSSNAPFRKSLRRVCTRHRIHGEREPIQEWNPV